MKKANVKKMVTLSLLIAIIVVLQVTAGQLPKLPGGASINLVLIPIVLGAAFYGAGAGAILGAVCGLIVFYYSFSGLDPVGFAIFTVNPIACFLICVGKSTLAGVAAGAFYKMLSNKNGYVAMLTAAIICPVVNTGLFMGSVWLFFRNTVAQLNESTAVTIVSLFGSILLLNAIPELLINILFSPAGQRILKAIRK